MKYELLVDPWAEACIHESPRDHHGQILNQLDNLSLAPVTLSRSAPSPPYPPGFQVFEFYISDEDGTTHQYAALFKYLSDEKHLWVGFFHHFDVS